MTGTDELLLAARVVGSLVVVLVLVGLVARAARRARARSGGDGVRVLERVGLSRDAYLAVVDAGGHSLLLGVTPQGISMLTSLSDPSSGIPQSPPTPQSPPPNPQSPPSPPNPQSPPSPPQPPELGLDLDGYPDLASALRAAGRTADAMPPGPPAPTERPPLPRRADVRRAQGRAASRIPRQRTPASGSVLSPGTWRQGIEALRELTVRRG